MRKIRYDVIRLTQTRRRHPFDAIYETAQELFLVTYDYGGARGVGVLFNTSIAAMNIDSFKQLTTWIGRLWFKTCRTIPALTIFVLYAPTSNFDGKKLEVFCTNLEKIYRNDHRFFKGITGDSNSKTRPKRTSNRDQRTSMERSRWADVRVYHDEQDISW